MSGLQFIAIFFLLLSLVAHEHGGSAVVYALVGIAAGALQMILLVRRIIRDLREKKTMT